jgi:enoyl-CoA hydratase
MAIEEERSCLVAEYPHVVWITINRPKELNALNIDVLQSLVTICSDLAQRSDLRCVVVTGSGEKAFAAGADIKTMAGLGPRAIADYVELGQRAMRAIERLPMPVIAAVNGYALGGGLELALAADCIVASDKAKLGLPEVTLGLIPGFGGTQRLVKRVGRGQTRRMIFTGEFIAADEALRIGLVEKVVAPDALKSSVETFVNTIVSKGPAAVRKAKEVLRMSEEEDTLGGLQREVEGFLSIFHTKEREEGVSAFLQNRTPQFNDEGL